MCACYKVRVKHCELVNLHLSPPMKGKTQTLEVLVLLIWVDSLSYPFEEFDNELPRLSLAQRYQEIVFVEPEKM